MAMSHDESLAIAAAEAEKVDTWCAVQGVETPTDLAFMFTSFEEALAEAGRAVANAWQLARDGSRAGLALGARRLLAEEKALHAAPKAKAKPSVSPRLQLKRPAKAPSKAVSGSLPPSAYLSGARAAPVVGDSQMMSIMLFKHRPSGDEEREALRAFVSEVVKKAEQVTLANAQRTWTELRTFVAALGVELDSIPALRLAAFIRGHKAPVRARNSLFWMNKNLKMEWDLSLVVVPRRKAPPSAFGTGARQAPVLPPAAILIIEELLVSEADHPKWTLLWGMHAMIFGVVRFSHIQRSCIYSVSDSMVTLWCNRGKQLHSRQGFFWQVPRHTVAGMDLWELLKSHLELFCADKDLALHQLTTPCVDTNSMQPVGISGFVHMARFWLQSSLASPALLSSYSFRRVGPTWAALAGLAEPLRLALGNWIDRGTVSATPHRYNAARLRQAAQVKLCLLGGVGAFGHHVTWTGLAHSAVKTHYEQHIEYSDRMLANDTVVMIAEEVRPTDDAVLAMKTSVVKHVNHMLKRRRKKVSSGSVPLPVAEDPPAPPAGEHAESDVVEVADDDAKDPASDEVFNAMARERWARPGHSGRPEPFCLIWRGGPGCGNLWLGGLPTEEDIEFLDRQNITLVLSAMSDMAKDTRNGLRSSHIMQFSVPVSYAGRDRAVAWDAARHLVPATIENGESILVHCLAGVHRGPVLTALLLALLCNSSLEDALRTISNLRAVEPWKVWERKGGHDIRDWVRSEIGRGWPALCFPKTWKWMCSVRDHSAWHVVPEGANGPLCPDGGQGLLQR